MRVAASLRDERGQTLVFMAVALGTLIAIVALVVSAGDWMQTQRRAQSVADAAALAGAQELPDQPSAEGEVANSATQNDWSGSPLETAFPDPSTIQVVAKQDVAGLFAPLAGVFNLTIETQARASVGTPATIANVAPVALRCDASCSPWSGTDTFTYADPDTPAGNTLAPVQLPGVTKQLDFRKYLQCDVQNPDSNCNPSVARAPASYDPLSLNLNQVRTSLENADGTSVHLFPVYDSFSDTDGYHVVGWAVGTFTVEPSVGPPGRSPVRLDVTFTRIVVDGTSLASGNGPKPTDFGVRAIALTG